MPALLSLAKSKRCGSAAVAPPAEWAEFAAPRGPSPLTELVSPTLRRGRRVGAQCSQALAHPALDRLQCARQRRRVRSARLRHVRTSAALAADLLRDMVDEIA